MNLRAIANRATSAINPNTAVSFRKCLGYGVNPAYKAGAQYADPVPLDNAQVQALSKKDVEHLDALNISNATRSVYANIQITPVNRQDQTGGDILLFENSEWLAVATLEGWSVSGWSRVAVAQQLS